MSSNDPEQHTCVLLLPWRSEAQGQGACRAVLLLGAAGGHLLPACARPCRLPAPRGSRPSPSPEHTTAAPGSVVPAPFSDSDPPVSLFRSPCDYTGSTYDPRSSSQPQIPSHACKSLWPQRVTVWELEPGRLWDHSPADHGRGAFPGGVEGLCYGVQGHSLLGALGAFLLGYRCPLAFVLYLRMRCQLQRPVCWPHP